MSPVNEYIDLVKNAQSDGRHAKDGNLHYKHHIFPRSLYPVLKNKSWNIVLLSYAEHKEAHRLLSLITVGRCNEIMIRDYVNYFGGDS